MITQRHSIKNLVLVDHEFSVPLDHARPSGPKLGIFARELALPDPQHASKPWLVFLQGGPGMPAPRPPGNTSWWKRALNDYRVDLPFDDTQRHAVLLARLLDDKPMSVRDKGPLFIIYPFDAEPSLRTTVYFSRSAWQLRSIEVL